MSDKPKMPEFCYSVMPSCGNLICIKYGDSGYYDCEHSTSDRNENRRLADELNTGIGVTKAQEASMLAASICGNWHCAAANPANYTENGRPVNPEQIVGVAEPETSAMKTYRVEITETLQATVEVEAEDFTDAEAKAEAGWKSGAYTFDDACAVDIRFDARGNMNEEEWEP